MNHRLNRSDYILSLVIVFLLVCVAAAFFLGMQVGANRTEAKYAALAAKQQDAARKPGSYDQQQLVSYYHTIYAPYRAFVGSWHDKLAELNRRGTVDASAVLKEAADIAEKAFKQLSNAAAPENSPLLLESHQNLLKGLKLLADTARSHRSGANAVPPARVAEQLDQDPAYSEAKQFVLQGQQQYYAAIVKWNETVEPIVRGADRLAQSSWTTGDWAQMSLNAKNAAVATLMLKERKLLPLDPQDMTARIDEWIESGQAGKLNLNDIGDMVNLLAETNAARKGDFALLRDTRYADEKLPQLPFFQES
jgi:hypothetical protein